MFNVINDCNALGTYTQWVENVVDEGSEEADLLSKLIDDDKSFATSIKLVKGEADINLLDIEYFDATDGITKQDSIAIKHEDNELSEGIYDDFCRAVYVGMCASCLNSEQLAKIL